MLSPKLGNIDGDTVTIETLRDKFKFSKKTGALVRRDFYNPISEDNFEKMVCLDTYEFSDHVECSGVWIPLRIAVTRRERDGSVRYKEEYSADPKTLRLLDKIDDSVFREQLSVGCGVDDDIRKRHYTVTTVDTLPNDIAAVKRMLDKMLEQAEEQKAAIEEKIKAWKKKK